MRIRSVPLAAAVFVLNLASGCRPFCGLQQWNCDTLGVCAFGTQPSYGTFASPGPYPQPQYGTPSPTYQYGTPAPGYGAQIQGNPTFVDPGNGATLGTPGELQPAANIQPF